MTEMNSPAHPAFETFAMPAHAPRSGTFGCFADTLARFSAMPRSTLVAEAVVASDGYERGNCPSHWRGVKKADLARFVASMRDGAPITRGEAVRIRAEREGMTSQTTTPTSGKPVLTAFFENDLDPAPCGCSILDACETTSHRSGRAGVAIYGLNCNGCGASTEPLEYWLTAKLGRELASDVLSHIGHGKGQ